MADYKKWPGIILMVVACLIYNACSQNASIDLDANEQERPIPGGMYFENNIEHINPDKSYTYWALIEVERSSGKPVFKFKVQRGNKNFKKYVAFKVPLESIYYISAMKNGKRYYFEMSDEVVPFLGQIESLAEALIVAKCYGYEGYSGYEGSYHIENDAYVMKLSRKDGYSFSHAEIAEVTVTKEGFIKTRSLEVAEK